MDRLQNRFKIYCNRCGAEIEIARTTDGRIIARDRDGFAVTEQYFTCQNCEKHYTVYVNSRQIEILMQKRRQIQKQIVLCRAIGSTEETIKKLIKKNDEIKQQQKELEAELKEKYKKECESDEHERDNFADPDSRGSSSN